MENMNSELYKIRSKESCIKVAFELLISNIATILRRSWLPALSFAIVSSVCLYFLIYTGLDAIIPIVPPMPIAKMAITIITFLCSLAAFSWYGGTILSLITAKQRKNCIGRVARINTALFAIGLLIAIFLGAVFMLMLTLSPAPPNITPAETTELTSQFSLALLVTAVIYIVIVMASIPLFYSTVKYAVDDKITILSAFTHQYIAGLKHWGFLFMLAFVSAIIEIIAMAVCYLPDFILTTSIFSNQTGLLIGDENTLPTLFPVIFIGINILVQFLIVYALTWAAFVFYYAYGSIEAQKK